jgi:hypothetical protein
MASHYASLVKALPSKVAKGVGRGVNNFMGHNVLSKRNDASKMAMTM